MADVTSSTGPQGRAGNNRDPQGRAGNNRDSQAPTPSMAHSYPPTLEGVLQGVPCFHEYLSGAMLTRLCSVSKDFRTTAINLATQVLMSERRACFGVPPYGDGTPAEREVLPEGFPIARLPGLVAQSEALLSEAALQISYTMQTIMPDPARVVARAPIRPLAKQGRRGLPQALWPAGVWRDFTWDIPTSPISPLVAERDRRRDQDERASLDMDALWWAEVEEEVRQGLRQTPVSSGGPFTRHDVLRVLALRAATKDRFQLGWGGPTRDGPSSYFGRFSMGLFLLKDGRVALVCTGTDVNADQETVMGSHVEISTSLNLLVRSGMANWERQYLGVRLPHTAEDRPADVRGQVQTHHHRSAAQGGGGAAGWGDGRGSKRTHGEVGRGSPRGGGGFGARQREEVGRMGGSGREERHEPVHRRPWHEEAWRWDSPFPPFWKGCSTQRVQTAKRPSSCRLSLHLASTGAYAANRECSEPLPGVSVSVTKWQGAKSAMDVWHVWQVDNRSSGAVHFCVSAPGDERQRGRPYQTPVQAGRCVDVLCVDGSNRFLNVDAWRQVVWEVVSEEAMRGRGGEEEEEAGVARMLGGGRASPHREG